MPKLHRLSLLASTALLALPSRTTAANELIDPAALGFGFAGYTLDITGQPSADYEDRAGGYEAIETRVIAPFYQWQPGDWIVGASVNYAWHHADFGGGFGLGRKDLHAIDLQMVAAWRPENSRWWALTFVSPGLNTDFESIGSDSFTISALGLLGYKVTPTLDLALGVGAGYSLRDARVLGALGLIWRPNDQWILQLTPPIIAIGWRPDRQWTIAAVAYPGGESWEVAETADGVRQVNLDLWRAALSVEYRIGDHWRAGARAGVSFGGELELRDSDARVLSSSDLETAPFAALAVRWAF